MRETSSVIRPELLRYVELVENQYPLLKSDFQVLYLKRTRSKRPLLRPFLARSVYELSNKTDWQNYKKVFAIVEAINISTYQSNLSFDSKNNIKSEKKRNNQYISSLHTLLLSNKFVMNDEDLSSSIKSQIINKIGAALEALYYGQYLDINVMTFKNKSMILNYDEFYKTYINRCKFIGSSLIEFSSDIAVILAGSSLSNILHFLSSFSTNLGIAGQIVNDLGDLTSNGKSYADEKFSDIKNGRLTYPIKQLAQQQSSNISKHLLLSLVKDKKAMNRVIKNTKEILVPYNENIRIAIKNIRSEGYNVSTLEWIGNLINKSRFLSLS